ncbi:hypothetical protein Gotur_016565 [Gossypium turneri]
MFNLRSVSVNMADETAWVGAGATLGELYYNIWKNNKIHGFPAGVCPTVGVGGHLSDAGNGEEDIPPEDPNTKKVRFKESNEILEDVMVVEPSPMPSLSWKDLLVGKETIEQKDASGTQHVDDSFSLLEQDVKKSVVNGIPSIDFSERIYQLLEKEMATSVVLKMLGRNIGSSQPPIQKADPHGDWGNGRKSNKLDFNIDSRARGRIANMVVYVNLRKPLISKLFINGNLQKIEYENLLVLCFSCERYGHNKESCLNTTHLTKPVKEVESTIQASPNSTTVRGKNYGPWMPVEQQTRCLTPEGNKKGNSISEEKIMGSRFQSLAGLKANSTDEGLNKEIQQELKRNGKAILTGSQGKSLIGKNPATVMTRKENLGQPV